MSFFLRRGTLRAFSIPLAFLAVPFAAFAQKSTQNYPTGLTFATYYDQKRTMYAGLGTESTDIVMLGGDFMDRGMWAESFGDPRIRNRGVDGDNLLGVAYRLDDVLKGKPAKIFLSIGKRDLSAGMSPSLAVSYLGDIVGRIHSASPRTKVYVVGILPDCRTDDTLRQKYREYNALVKEKASGITYIDLWETMAPDGVLKEDYYYGSSLLLNGKGYKAAVEALQPYLSKSVLDTAGAREDYPLKGYVRERNSLIEYLPATTDDILMIGNSITQGGEWAELFRNRNVKNRGINSDVSDGVLARLPRMLREQPRKVFLKVGVNDLGNPPQKTKEYALANVLKVVDEIHRLAPKTKVYVESLLPVNPVFPTFRSHTGFTEEVKYINKGLREAAASHNYTFIDLHRSFTDADGHLDARYTNDGLHLTWEGYRLWRDILLPYMNEPNNK